MKKSEKKDPSRPYRQMIQELHSLDSLSREHKEALEAIEAVSRGSDFDKPFGQLEFSDGQMQELSGLYDLYLHDIAISLLADERIQFANPRPLKLLVDAFGPGYRGMAKKAVKAELHRIKGLLPSITFDYQKRLRDRLEEMVNMYQVRPGAERFCLSVVEQFDISGFWSPVQQDVVEKILRGNLDPDEVPSQMEA